MSGSARAVLAYIDHAERQIAQAEADRLAARRSRLLTLPLMPHVYAELSIVHPMTPQEWDRLIDLLLAMRPGLVDG